MNIKITSTSEPLTDLEIDFAEQNLGRLIPVAYRKFLLKYNGGRPDPSDFKMAGLRPGTSQIGTVKRFLGINLAEMTLNIDYVLDTFHNRVPANFFPIARDPGGNLIGIAMEGVNTGKIYFWDHEREADEGESPTDKNLYFIANSFEEFLNKLGNI